MNINGITRIFSVFKRNTPLVTKPAKTAKSDLDSGDSTTDRVRFSERKDAEASTHFMTYDSKGQIHEEGPPPPEDPEDPSV